MATSPVEWRPPMLGGLESSILSVVDKETSEGYTVEQIDCHFSFHSFIPRANCLEDYAHFERLTSLVLPNFNRELCVDHLRDVLGNIKKSVLMKYPKDTFLELKLKVDVMASHILNATEVKKEAIGEQEITTTEIETEVRPAIYLREAEGFLSSPIWDTLFDCAPKITSSWEILNADSGKSSP